MPCYILRAGPAHNGCVMFWDWFTSPRSENTWHSWWSMAITIPFFFGIMLTIPRARQEEGAASRQQTTEGTVTSYQKSNHNRCSYTFAVHGKPYSGRDSCPNDNVALGEQVTVYYDREKPHINALEDFSAHSGRDQGFGTMCLCGIGIFAGVVLYTRAQHRAKQRSGIV